MTQQLKVRKGFSTSNDSQVIALTSAVIAGLTDNKAFPNPPVELAAVQTALDALVDAVAAQAHGGVTATAEKNNKREALIALLRKLAHYVEGSSTDLAVVLSSGFQTVTVSRSQSALGKPSIVRIDFGASSRLLVRVRPIEKAKCYEARSSTIAANGAAGPWQPGGLSTNSRIELNGLTPGTNYAVQIRAVGGSTGFSDWSDPVVHMCA